MRKWTVRCTGRKPYRFEVAAQWLPGEKEWSGLDDPWRLDSMESCVEQTHGGSYATLAEALEAVASAQRDEYEYHKWQLEQCNGDHPTGLTYRDPGERFDCPCQEHDYPLWGPGPDESTWCQCGLRIDDQRVAAQANACRYLAHFQAQAFAGGYGIDVDPQGPTQWEVSDAVRANWSYWQALLSAGGDFAAGVGDDGDTLKADPYAPVWVREWSGPFTITVRSV